MTSAVQVGREEGRGEGRPWWLFLLLMALVLLGVVLSILLTRPFILSRRSRSRRHVAMPRLRSVFSTLLRPSFSISSNARIASTFSGMTSDSWWTAWK